MDSGFHACKGCLLTAHGSPGHMWGKVLARLDLGVAAVACQVWALLSTLVMAAPLLETASRHGVGSRS